MSIEIEAIYEAGVFRPVSEITLAEHQRVRIVVHTQSDTPWRLYGALRWTGDPYTLQQIALDPDLGATSGDEDR